MAIRTTILIVCIFLTGCLAEEYEPNIVPTFKVIDFTYMNISCKGCFNISDDKLDIIEIIETVGNVRIGKALLRKGNAKIHPEIDIKVPLSPCVDHNILYVVYFKDERGTRQNQSKEAGYHPEKGWLNKISNKIESAICTTGKNISIHTRVAKLRNIRSNLVRLCLSQLLISINKESPLQPTSQGTYEVGKLQSFDKLTINFATINKATETSKVFMSFNFTGDQLNRKLPCTTDSNILYIVLGLSLVAFLISFSIFFYTVVQRMREKRARNNIETREMNPYYMRGTSIYGHVGEITDTNPDYERTPC